MVIRQGKVFFKSPQQQHAFNFPYQLGSQESDSPYSADLYDVPVQKGDIVVRRPAPAFLRRCRVTAHLPTTRPCAEPLDAGDFSAHPQLLATDGTWDNVRRCPAQPAAPFSPRNCRPVRPLNPFLATHPAVSCPHSPPRPPQLFDDEICRIVDQEMSRSGSPQAAAERVANAAQIRGADTRTMTPFAVSAMKNRLVYRGGKQDDVTVVVAVVSDAPGAGGEAAERRSKL